MIEFPEVLPTTPSQGMAQLILWGCSHLQCRHLCLQLARLRDLKKGILGSQNSMICKKNSLSGFFPCAIAARIITTNTLQKHVLAQFTCTNYKAITLQSKFLRMFSYKQGQTSGSNFAKKMFWLNYCCSNNPDYYKRKISKTFCCNNLARMVSIKEAQTFCFLFFFIDSCLVEVPLKLDQVCLTTPDSRQALLKGGGEWNGGYATFVWQGCVHMHFA